MKKILSNENNKINNKSILQSILRINRRGLTNLGLSSYTAVSVITRHPFNTV